MTNGEIFDAHPRCNLVVQNTIDDKSECRYSDDLKSCFDKLFSLVRANQHDRHIHFLHHFLRDTAE